MGYHNISKLSFKKHKNIEELYNGFPTKTGERLNQLSICGELA